MNESKSLFRRALVCHGLSLLLVTASNGAVTPWWVGPAMAAPPVIDGATLRRKQDDQQRARAMARDLLTSVLDVQLRQLEENGLTEISVYRDIKVMHSNIGNLVDTEMAQVVQQLADAQELTPEQREASFIEARQTIRNIVIRLSAERQNLLRRLKSAELAEQVKRLIKHQTTVHEQTVRIPEESKTLQESLAIRTREDQRDVGGLFVQLVGTLTDVRNWGGTIGEGATAGIALLAEKQVGKHLDQAEKKLRDADYAVASHQQVLVIAGLQDLLRVIERTQGLLDSREQQTIEKVRELLAAEKALRDQVAQLDQGVPVPEEIVNQQSALQQKVAALSSEMSGTSTAQEHAEAAAKAAFEATAKLLENETDSALASQNSVIGRLSALEAELTRQAASSTTDQAAAELKANVARLEQAEKLINEAASRIDTALEQVAEVPTAIPESAVAEAARAKEKTQQAQDIGQLPPNVDAAIEMAAEATATAAKPSNELNASELSDAKGALELAQATIKREKSAAERKAAALEIGELARAAEILERAASEERAIAAKAQDLAKTPQSQPSHAATELTDRAKDVADIAELIEKSTKEADVASQTALAQANEAAKKSVEQFEEAKNQSPEEPTSKETLQKAGQVAENAAKKLAAAANALRDNVQKKAEALAKLSEQAADEAAQVKADTEEVLTQEMEARSNLVEQIAQAQEVLSDAIEAQLKASGSEEAAAASAIERELNQISQDMQEARQANPAAKTTPNTGDQTAPAISAAERVEQAAKQQELADHLKAAAGRVAKELPMETGLQKQLSQAATSAEAAAQALASAKASQAAAAQQKASDLMKNAQEIARQKAQTLRDQPAENKGANSGNAQDQQVANRAIEAAQKAVQKAASSGEKLGAAPKAAAQELSEAKIAGEKAAGQLEAGDQAAAAEKQSDALSSLQEAQASLKKALQQAMVEQANQLAKTADQAGDLVSRAAEVDEAAAAALAQAANKDREPAVQGSEESMASPGETSAGQQTTGQQALNSGDKSSGDNGKAKPPQGSTEIASSDNSNSTPNPSKTDPSNGDSSQASNMSKAGQNASGKSQDQASSNKADMTDAAAGDQPSTADSKALAQQRDQVETDLARAAANLAAAEQRLRQEAAIAQAIADQSRAQQAAAQQIADQREMANQAATSGSASPGINATELAKATQKFAQAQRATGQAVSQLSGQQAVGNSALKEALKSAGELAGELSNQPPSPSSSETSTAGQSNDAGNAQASSRQEGTNPGQATSNSGKSSMSGESGAGEKSSPPALDGAYPNDLGSEFVPSSPEITARMMAGSAAQEALNAALADLASSEAGAMNDSQSALAEATGDAPGTPSPESSAMANEASNASSQQSSSAQGVQQGTGTENQGLKTNGESSPDAGKTPPSQAGKVGGRDTPAGTRTVEQQPWFAKLPPELRNAIRANSQQRAPRAYEEKLKRYFESTD